MSANSTGVTVFAHSEVVVEGFFWLKRRLSDQELYVPGTDVYQGLFLCSTSNTTERGMPLAIRRNVDAIVSAGKGYEMSGSLQWHVETSRPVIHVKSESIISLDDSSGESKVMDGLHVKSTGIVVAFIHETTAEGVKTSVRTFELRSNDLAVRVLYRITQDLYRDQINNSIETGAAVRVEGLLHSFDVEERALVVEVHRAEFI